MVTMPRNCLHRSSLGKERNRNSNTFGTLVSSFLKCERFVKDFTFSSSTDNCRVPLKRALIQFIIEVNLL